MDFDYLIMNKADIDSVVNGMGCYSLSGMWSYIYAPIWVE